MREQPVKMDGALCKQKCLPVIDQGLSIQSSCLSVCQNYMEYLKLLFLMGETVVLFFALRALQCSHSEFSNIHDSYQQNIYFSTNLSGSF